MTKKEKKERLALIAKRLEDLYPIAPCALEYKGDGWKLLVMGRLSAQCTDAMVNKVCRVLFERYKSASQLANAELSDVERIIKPCGLYRVKAKNIIDASKRLIRDYDGTVPNVIEELLKFEGVGRKVANLLIGDLYAMPCVVCDTHCIRICARFGMYSEKEKNPDKIEKILRELLDISSGSDFCHRIVLFGREICTARNPACNSCPISELCEHFKKRKEKT
jgi:endonuclease-3